MFIWPPGISISLILVNIALICTNIHGQCGVFGCAGKEDRPLQMKTKVAAMVRLWLSLP